MKKILLLFTIVFLTSCGSFKTYNSALKQIELGMTKYEVVDLMGDDYKVKEHRWINNEDHETIVYKDMFKFYWNFEFINGYLYRWYKETEND